ncbi:unnamed protein product [Lota lota]
MSEPPKEDFRKEHGFSKKLLINCCLVRRIITWATPTPKGKTGGAGGAACRWQPPADGNRLVNLLGDGRWEDELQEAE